MGAISHIFDCGVSQMDELRLNTSRSGISYIFYREMYLYWYFACKNQKRIGRFFVYSSNDRHYRDSREWSTYQLIAKFNKEN